MRTKVGLDVALTNVSGGGGLIFRMLKDGDLMEPLEFGKFGRGKPGLCEFRDNAGRPAGSG